MLIVKIKNITGTFGHADYHFEVSVNEEVVSHGILRDFDRSQSYAELLLSVAGQVFKAGDPAMLMSDRFDAPAQRFRLFGRESSGWAESPLFLGPANGYDLVSWLGRTFTTGNDGQILEIALARGGFRVCPAVAFLRRP